VTNLFLPRILKFERAPSLSVLLAGAILATTTVPVIAWWLRSSTARDSQPVIPAANEITLEFMGP
jgi:hypothetical protein